MGRCMRVFLSYASERREVAEGVALALRGQGHTVFFDRDDLPAGTNYDGQIRKAIDASRLLVFLISPESVAIGRYTLTELSFARRRWPSPHGRVLPVEIAKTPKEAIPGYLKAVTILEPGGNVPAEIAGAVADLSRRRARWRWPAAAAATAIVAIAIGLWRYGPGDRLEVEALGSERAQVGLFGATPSFDLKGRLTNRARGWRRRVSPRLGLESLPWPPGCAPAAPVGRRPSPADRRRASRGHARRHRRRQRHPHGPASLCPRPRAPPWPTSCGRSSNALCLLALALS